MRLKELAMGGGARWMFGVETNKAIVGWDKTRIPHDSSTMLQEAPRLHEYHHGLLGNARGSKAPPINLEATIGCQNWVFIGISEISQLDAWKESRRRAGALDMMELDHQATVIKTCLQNQLMRFEAQAEEVPRESDSVLDLITTHNCPGISASIRWSSRTKSVWAHAALLYLYVVVSGWQPASAEVQCHVVKIIEILNEISPHSLLRTMVWPFYIAGLLSEPHQEDCFRTMARRLCPPTIFGTLRKALDAMEIAWRNRNATNIASYELATFFNSPGI